MIIKPNKLSHFNLHKNLYFPILPSFLKGEMENGGMEEREIIRPPAKKNGGRTQNNREKEGF